MGIQWLQSLGPILTDWKAQTLQLDWEGETHILNGLHQNEIQPTSREEIEKEARQGHLLFALCSTAISPELKELNDDFRVILEEFNGIFESPDGLPPPRDIEHTITLKEGTDPINVRPYRYAYFQKDEIERQVTDMLKAGIIRTSTSPFSSPVLLVKKKDGSWRFCTDYRALNSATIKDQFPIPTAEDMLDELHGSAYFTKLDLTAGFHQVRMRSTDIHKTAFRTHHGYFEYLVMPFGLCNAPSTFQSLMNDISGHTCASSCLFFSTTFLSTTHLQHVREVLSLIQHHQLSVKFKKCEFGKRELEYLGHIISNTGVTVDQSKVQAMTDWPVPTSVTELRGFLGLTGYYRKFVHDYGLIARPLTNLFRKGKFTWSSKADTAFNKLKEAMTSTPTLALPNFSMPFVIETDASGDGIGAVLSQNGQPITFMSRSLGVTKKVWSTYAREMLAVIVGIRTWRPYLLGRKFTIQTDQRSLRYMLEQRILTPEQQKWMSKLVGYDYDIVYKPGKTNSAADALSRVPNSPILNALSVPHTSFWDDLRALASSDPYLLRIGVAAKGKPGLPYSWKDGLLCYNNRVVVPPGSPLIKQLLYEHHDTTLGGHSGVLRTFKRLSHHFYWPSMHKTVVEYISHCDTCQRAKSQTMSPAGLLQPLPVPEQLWEDISMDFVDGLPRSGSFTSIMVVVDRLSKSAHLISLSHPYTTSIVASRFVANVIKLHGLPRMILSDRDPVFLSHFWKELWRLSGTTLKMSTAYHPQTDGQTEVVNRCIEQYLRCFVQQRPTHWSSFLPWAEYWYNTTFHSSTGTTPFQALYGRPPPAIPRYELGSTLVGEIDEQLQRRDELLDELKQHLEASNNRTKQLADTHRRDVEYKIGDWVFLRLQPYRQKTVLRRSSQKLSHRYFGPFKVEARIVNVAYRLALPATARIHPVFHVSLLKKRVGDEEPVSVQLPPLKESGTLRLTPAKVLQQRTVQKFGKELTEILVQWVDLPATEATWEDTHQITTSFPTFHMNLEDKVLTEDGSVDRIQEEEEDEM
ncbi:hypothetical protein YC2023_081344 [Brassica napus]